MSDKWTNICDNIIRPWHAPPADKQTYSSFVKGVKKRATRNESLYVWVCVCVCLCVCVSVRPPAGMCVCSSACRCVRLSVARSPPLPRARYTSVRGGASRVCTYIVVCLYVVLSDVIKHAGGPHLTYSYSVLTCTNDSTVLLNMIFVKFD